MSQPKFPVGTEVRIVGCHNNWPRMIEAAGRCGIVQDYVRDRVVADVPLPYRVRLTPEIADPQIYGINNSIWREEDLEIVGKFKPDQKVICEGHECTVVAFESKGMVRLSDEDGEFVRHEDLIAEVV